MRMRCLPHFAHSPIGKTTHKRGFSYQNVNYITRPEACSMIMAENMPDDRSGARPYFERQAYRDGVPENARIADTLIIALPLELSREQRHEVVAGWMAAIGKHRIAWLAAFHDMGKDEANPHCHIIFRDADIDTGRKVLGTTTSSKDVKEAQEKGWKVPPRMTTKDLRIAWCEHLNAAMERFGHDARFDQRTLKSQGIDRKPGIHIGPKAMQMAAKGKIFESRDRQRGEQVIAYSLLDTGSRVDQNRRIAELNAGRMQRFEPSLLGASDPLRDRQVAERKVLYREQALDRAALRDAHRAQNLAHQRWARALDASARTDQAATATLPMIKQETWQRLKAAQDAERVDLKQRHSEELAAVARQHAAERRRDLSDSLLPGTSVATDEGSTRKGIRMKLDAYRLDNQRRATERRYDLRTHMIAGHLSSVVAGKTRKRTSATTTGRTER